jgi:hypothetical protein
VPIPSEHLERLEASGAPLAGTSNLYQVTIQSYRRDYYAPDGPGAGAPCHLRVGANAALYGQFLCL